MKILLNNNDLNEALYGVSNLGFVPTMGSLHKGHISLIQKSLKECDKTLISIFVNPKQFNNKKDFINYPRNIKDDLSILKKMKVDFLYLPKKKDIYDLRNITRIYISTKERILCAKYRKGHFEGVIDVMHRLTNKIKPWKIFMGEKDFQQLHMVKKFIEKKHKSKVVPCKTVRNKDKVALSSRNLLLKKSDLAIAGKIAKKLISLKNQLKKEKNKKQFLFLKKKEIEKFYNIKIQYLELRNKFNLKTTNKTRNAKIFVAYYLKNIRLIDNF